MAVANAITGAGYSGDPQLSFQQIAKSREMEQEQAFLYCYNQWLRRAVDIVADDITRQWIQVQSPKRRGLGPLDEWMRSCGPQHTSMAQVFNQAMKWSMVFGASGIVMVPADGVDMASPLERGSDRQVERLQVFSRWRFIPDMAHICMDMRSPWYGMPEWWFLWPQGPWLTYIKPMRIHVSRIVFMQWNSTPDTMIRFSYGFGDSCMMMWREYAIGLDAAYQIMQRSGMQQSTYVLKTSNLMDMAVNERTRTGLATRTAEFQRSLGQYRMAVIDKEKEELEKLTGGMDGMLELFHTSAETFCGATGLKFTVLMGVPPRGRESAGEYDIRCHYDFIKKIYRNRPHNCVERVLNAKGWTGLNISLRQQWQVSDIEKARRWTMEGKAMKDLVMAGIISPQDALDLFMAENGPTSGPDGIETLDGLGYVSPGVPPPKAVDPNMGDEDDGDGSEPGEDA